jgi:hypothetical protein
MKAAKLSMAAALVGATLIASGSLTTPAADWTTKTFDITYFMTTPTGSSQMRMASDGRGKVLTQTEVSNIKVTSVADYPAKVAYSIMDAQKMVYKMRLPEQQNNVSTDEGAKKLGAKSLGMKVIDGHPCRGWLYCVKDSTTETWVAIDLEAAMKSVTKTPQGSTTMVLKSLSEKIPDPKLFAIPADYKVIEAPQ